MVFQKKDCIAMILAGGQGSRLRVLTETTAKPAVPFGGKYRLIDFPLSNCVNSGIDTVGILTQYQPLQLNEYLGSGQPWGLTGARGGIHVLSPYSRAKSAEWYKGTANAIYQNLSFIDRYEPENVLILSGDHIYRMDYAAMMAAHQRTGADATIAVLNVPLAEASRFGIMTCGEDGRITEFEEKPKKPKSTRASMGVYLFRWSLLRRMLIRDSADPDSKNDFGKNIIPGMLAEGHHLYAYSFSGYWKDVGTIESLWQSNMDILGATPALDMAVADRRIYARNDAYPPSYIAPGAVVTDSYVAEGSTVLGEVHHAVISCGCVIGEGAVVCDSFVMPGSVIGPNSSVAYAIIGENAVIGDRARVGGRPDHYDKKQWGIAVVGGGKAVEPDAVLPPASLC